MSENECEKITETGKIYKLGWLAYVPLVLMMIAAYIFIRIIDPITNAPIKAILLFLVAAFFTYNLFYLYSVKLYTNEKGAWLYRGVLPWNKGTYGVRWEEMDDATYCSGFLAWATNNYEIEIRHRFTKDIEIYARRVKDGHKFALEVNQKLDGMRSRID